MAHVLNTLGQNVLPQIFEALNAAGLNDLMDVIGEESAAGTGGGRVKSAAPNVYTSIPVTYEKTRIGSRLMAGDQPVELGNFLLKFPVYHNGARVNIDAKHHKIRIQARGLEPVKIFTIRGEPFDNQGVLWEVEGEKKS